MQGKVVVITGGSSGIGRACAQVFGEAGAKIVITGRNETNLQEASQWLSSKKIEVLPIVSDVSIENDSQNMVRKTLEHFGKLDVLINNAGISMRANFEELDLKVIRQLMDVNFYGTVYATKYALPEILKNQGIIVGISSIAGYRGLPGRTGYSASKFAMNGFLESLRTELKGRAQVLTVCPGFTASNIRNVALTKDGSTQGESPRDEAKMMTAEEVARRTLKAIQQKKAELVLTGQGKLTVFLSKWLPKKVMDRLVANSIAKEEKAS